MTIVPNDPYAAAANSLAINAIMAQGGQVLELSENTYIENVDVTSSGSKLIGKGSNASRLISTVPGGGVVNIGNDLAHVAVEGFTIIRDAGVVPDATAAGIDCKGTLYYPRISGNEIYGHGDGVRLRGCGYGHFERNAIYNNYGNGVSMMPSTGATFYGALQWIVEENICELNNGSGFAVSALAGVPQVTMGEWINNRTYANKGHGMVFNGLPAVPINNIRISGGTIGEDGNDEININGYGGGHVIRGLFAELAGRSNTGRNASNPASHIGNGIVISANDTMAEISNCHITGMSNHGILSRASRLTMITGSYVANNGMYGFCVGDPTKWMMTGSATYNNTSGPIVCLSGSPASIHGGANKLS